MVNSPNNNEKNQNIVASFLILKKDNKILLSKRMNTGYHDGDYGLVSGHVEKGESFSKAIIREAYEEAGIILNEKNLSAQHVMHRKSDFDKSERVDVYFVASIWKGNVENREPDKCECLTWFNPKDLPINMVPCVKTAIQKIYQNIAYSEHGW